MWRRIVEKVSSRLMFLATLFCALLVVVIAIRLLLESVPPIREVTSSVTGILMAISVPLSLLRRTHLSEHAPKRIRDFVRQLVDFPAGIPSMIFGLCIFLVTVPLIRDYMYPLSDVSTPMTGTSRCFCRTDSTQQWKGKPHEKDGD
ncbi:MAG: hypothetical protein KAW84_04050 [Thermoplasmata archaeon]|nr:hypothetical protein [Thermoplasmata archaeon]